VFWLLSISYLFYLTWQPAFILVLIGETLLAFLIGKKLGLIANQEQKKLWLIFGICLLLLPLVFFKYFNFLNQNLTALLGLFETANPIFNQPYLIPLGISFFTFQAISYVVDIYRGYLKPEKKLAKFAVYMAFFPTILAGPIERAKSILGQLNVSGSFTYENVRAGLQLILWGVFKKVVIADRLKDFMDKAYANPQDFQGILIYFAIVFSVFHLFCDFSAYSDIAVGSARIFGIKLSKNFDDRVYAVPSRAIFWQGWHRSLTSWLRDYVFFPLSKNVKTQKRLYLNLLIVYLLVGFWHGATWGFIVWGLLNGVWLIGENYTKNRREEYFTRIGFDINGSLFNFLAWFFIFHIGVLFGVFFRTDTPQKALDFIANLVNSNANLLARWEFKSCLLAILFIVFMDLINRKIPQNGNFDEFIGRQKTIIRWGLYLLLSQMILRYIHVFDNFGFVYFNF
jgi:D-alanyl-lipoteichoic acid acyltransferase DltB (MBOAT superfamily)